MAAYPDVMMQTKNAHQAAIGLLRMHTGGQDFLRELRSQGADLGCPAKKPFRCPLLILPVRRRHVLGYRGVAALVLAPLMAGNPLPPVKTFDNGRGDADVEPPFHQPRGYAVIMAVYFDVIIDMHRCLLPQGKLVGRERQWPESRFVETFEQALP